MKSLFLIIFWAMIASCLFAQETVIVKKVDSSDKTVSVDVKKSGDSERTFKIVTNENGDNKVIEWTDNGEIPDDIKKQLEDQGIDIEMLEGGEGHEMVLEVESDEDGEEREVRKEIIKLKKVGEDGEVMEMEWDGEGEMPAEMREMMDKHEIEIHEGHGKNHKMKKMKVHKDKRRAKRHKSMKDGREKNMQKRNEYKIVTIDEDGNEKVKTWVEDGDSEGNMLFGDDEDQDIIFKSKGGKGKNIFRFSTDEEELSDAYMGAQIDNGDDGGARVIELMKDSPADKAGLQKGDVIHRVNGARARTMEDLLGILRYYDPKDQVELTVHRNGSEKKIKLTLGQRPGGE